MWAPKRIDIGPSDLATGLTSCIINADTHQALRALEQEWPAARDLVICHSVRSGFDALLTSLALPVGSHVMFTAMSIEDMPRIAEHHELVPVPVDIDVDTLAPSLEALEGAVTDRTQLLVLAHLFGGRVDFSATITWAAQRGIRVIEDCAQAYWNRAYLGDPTADVALFSFGPIKHRTALGGAFMRIRCADLRGRVQSTIDQYPVQRPSVYASRLLKYGSLNILSMRLPYALMLLILSSIGKDHDRLVNNLTRGMGGGGFLTKLRQRPCAALIRMLRRRVSKNTDHLSKREKRGRLLTAELGPRVLCPGLASQPHSFWIFPIMPTDRLATLSALRKAGFDATAGRSFALVEGSADESAACPTAARICDGSIYLPFYPEMPDGELLRMAAVVRGAEEVSRSALEPTVMAMRR